MISSTSWFNREHFHCIIRQKVEMSFNCDLDLRLSSSSSFILLL